MTKVTEGKFLTKEGKLEVDPEMRDVQVSVMPLESAEKYAKAIVDSACHGGKYLTVLDWAKTIRLWKVFCPEIIDWCKRFLSLSAPGSSHKDAPSKKISDLANGVKEFLSLDRSLVS
ncbi:hypothetical protein REPUB_Repub08aG0032300 [Reevesia pubescens]